MVFGLEGTVVGDQLADVWKEPPLALIQLMIWAPACMPSAANARSRPPILRRRELRRMFIGRRRAVERPDCRARHRHPGAEDNRSMLERKSRFGRFLLQS